MKGNGTVTGSVTAPRGFKAAGVHAGIRASRPDLALIVSERPAVIAGVFTTNRIQAAPVKLCRERLARRQARAIIVNSGNANACTGSQGLADAKRMAFLVAERLGLDEETVFVCSTGAIGVPLPMDKVESGIMEAVEALSKDGGASAAKAILTTDTVDKQAAAELTVDGVQVRVGAMGKGAGMIEPNMATLLAFLTTDAVVEPGALQDCLSHAVADSFNKISVDGDQSTNDTVLFMANGAAGNRALNVKHPAWDVFSAAVNKITEQIALKLVQDGEGATKLVTVKVRGAASAEDAAKAARAVANSLLVKTSWYGCDPNWGRVMGAVGYSGADVREDLVEISYDGVCIVKNGQQAPEVHVEDLKRVLARKNFVLNIDLHLGDGTDTVYTCDCTKEYVRINSKYMT